MQETSKPTRLAFAGAGNVTSGPYSQAVLHADWATLIGVYDPDTAASSKLADAHGARAFASLDDLLNDAEVEAVVVGTPNSTHYDVATACLRAGKHVLIEKPVGQTVDEIDGIRALANERGLVAMPAHNFIYQATLEKARTWISDGRLGTMASTWVLYNLFHPEDVAARYPGVLRQIGVHLSYSLLYLHGRPVRVSATSTRVHYESLDQEDQIMLVCQMADGSIANLWASFAASDPTSDPWTVVFKGLGSKGGFSYTWNEAQFEDDGGPAWGVPSYMDGFASELEFFCREAVLNGRTPRSTLAESRDCVRIIEAAERSLAADSRAELVDYS